MLVRFLILLSWTAALLAQSNRDSCEVTGPTAQSLQTLPSMSDTSLPWEQRMAPRRALAAKEPSNWPLQLALQDPISRQFFLGKEWDSAIAAYRRNPDRVLGELLEARLSGMLHRKRSREMLDRVLAAAPDSPWPHLAMAEWAMHPASSDRALAARHLVEFRTLCPQNTRGFRYLDALDDAPLLAKWVGDLRASLDQAKKRGLRDADLPLFRYAWNWEAVLAGESGRDVFLRTVRDDLTAIRASKAYSSMEWYSTLRHGYEQTLKDTAALQSLYDEIRQQAPRSQSAWFIEDEKVRQSMPDARNTTSEQMTQWQTKMKAELHQRILRYGEQPFVGFGIHQLIFGPNPPLEDAEFLRLGDMLLRLREQYPDHGSSWPPVSILLADEYAKRKVRLDQVPQLVERGLQEIEFQEKHRRDSDAMPKGGMDNVAMTHTRAREIYIRLALARNETDRARTLLAEYRRLLESTVPANPDTREASPWRRDHYMYLTLAKLAGMPAEPIAILLPAKPETSERIAVADFTAQDLSGRTWTLADLKGKVAYVNIWATWCTPCRAEMPALEKLHQRWKDRKDRVVLTISADLHPDLVRSFLSGYQYTFPVIARREIAEKFFPAAFFPQNWIIDPDGKRLDLRAPGAFDSTLPQIEELADKIASPPKRQ